MMRFSKSCLAGLLMLSAAASARADFIATDLASWGAAPVVIGDKEFTLESFGGVDAADTVKFASIGNNYIVQLSDLGNNVPGGLSLIYDVTVLNPFNAITAVDMDTDIPLGGASVHKDFFDSSGALVAALDSAGSPQIIGIPGVRSLHVVVTGSGASAGTLFSLTDSYHQSVVPEPTTFAMAGAGLLGLIALARRRLV